MTIDSRMNLNFLLQHNDAHQQLDKAIQVKHLQQKQKHQASAIMELANAASMMSNNTLTPYSTIPFSPVSTHSNVSIEERVERLQVPTNTSTTTTATTTTTTTSTTSNCYRPQQQQHQYHQQSSSSSPTISTSTLQQQQQQQQHQQQLLQQQHHHHIITTQIASRSHICPTCGESFSLKVRFLHHLFTTHQVRQYETRPILPCIKPDCDSAFLRNTDRSKHNMCVHLKLRPYKCDVTNCTSSFFFAKDLTKHKDTVHLRYKPFNCRICQKAFGKREHMTSHVRRVHQKLRPFKCEVCDIRLASKYNLQGHLKTAAHAAAETLARRGDINSIVRSNNTYITRTR